MLTDTIEHKRTFPLKITPEELEAYRKFLITLATVVSVDNPIYKDAASIIARLEDFIEDRSSNRSLTSS